jgi:hypothetical protein
MKKQLTLKQEKFACEFIKTGNACESYKIAYDAEDMSPKSIGRKACALKANPAIAARIAELQQAAAEQAEIKAADVLKMWVEIATADPNELVQIHHVSCPECYQGLINKTQEPNSQCAFCSGEGVEQVYIADTAKLTGSAKLLYKGARKTKYGAEVILRDQDAALANIAKYLGMFDKPQEITKPNTPSTSISDIKNFPKDIGEATRFYLKFMRGD